MRINYFKQLSFKKYFQKFQLLSSWFLKCFENGQMSIYNGYDCFNHSSKINPATFFRSILVKLFHIYITFFKSIFNLKFLWTILLKSILFLLKGSCRKLVTWFLWMLLFLVKGSYRKLVKWIFWLLFFLILQIFKQWHIFNFKRTLCLLKIIKFWMLGSTFLFKSIRNCMENITNCCIQFAICNFNNYKCLSQKLFKSEKLKQILWIIFWEAWPLLQFIWAIIETSLIIFHYVWNTRLRMCCRALRDFSEETPKSSTFYPILLTLFFNEPKKDPLFIIGIMVTCYMMWTHKPLGTWPCPIRKVVLYNLNDLKNVLIILHNKFIILCLILLEYIYRFSIQFGSENHTNSKKYCKQFKTLYQKRNTNQKSLKLKKYYKKFKTLFQKYCKKQKNRFIKYSCFLQHNTSRHVKCLIINTQKYLKRLIIRALRYKTRIQKYLKRLIIRALRYKTRIQKYIKSKYWKRNKRKNRSKNQ